jgi:uncharacterized protein YdhG (YjbR/CyaY superfamily)
VGTVDDYFASLDEGPRTAYERVRDLALAEVPEAEQGAACGMVALKYRGRSLLGFRAGRSQLMVFPFSPRAVEAVQHDLAATAVVKGAVRFDPAEPLPEPVVRALVRRRATEIDTPRRRPRSS